MDKFMSSIINPKPVACKDQGMSIKGLSVAKWLNANGYGDNDKNLWKEHMLWSQTDQSLNFDLPFTNSPTLDELLYLPGFFF